MTRRDASVLPALMEVRQSGDACLVRSHSVTIRDGDDIKAGNVMA